VLLQASDLLVPLLSLPDWASRLVFLLLAIGFVPALIIAWAFEVTPEGIKREIDVDSAATSGGMSGIYVAAVIFLVVIGMAAYWYAGREARWAVADGIPRIERFIDAGDWEAAFTMANRVENALPDDPALKNLWTLMSFTTSIPSDPAGANVFRRPYADPDAQWQELGMTPLLNIRIPFGFSLIRLELDGHQSLLRVFGTDITRIELLQPLERQWPNYADLPPETYRFDVDGTSPDGFVRVSGLDVNEGGESISYNDYFLGRNEVTNREYRKFVDAGGYQRQDLWQQDVIRDGLPVAWEETMALFTDLSGRAGPSTWEGGTYPDGEDYFPVAGVSWYEAAAYARFVGRELPTWYHWRKAFSTAMLPNMLPASNLENDGPAPVGTFDGIGWTGTNDMIGNVREWCFNAVGDQRVIVGGGWNDAYYVAHESVVDAGSLDPFNRSATNGIRLAFTTDDATIAARLRQPMPVPEHHVIAAPVSDEIFGVYRTAFDYDAGPLLPIIEETETASDWRIENITFKSAYSDERVRLLLYLPNSGADVFQTVLYWPGTGAFFLDSVDQASHHLEFLLKNGRAVAFPIYQGTFDRRMPELPLWTTIAGRDLATEQVKDLRRTIDYLETRPDIDRQSLAYYGSSWGGRLGAVVLAVEPRLRTAILDQAGISFEVRPEIDVTHYLPRVSQPVLQFNGRYDSDFRYETSARPFFEMLGTNPADKKHVVEPTGHFVSRPVAIGETLNWLDKYLGPVKR
jgi:hypothetical protein